MKKRWKKGEMVKKLIMLLVLLSYILFSNAQDNTCKDEQREQLDRYIQDNELYRAIVDSGIRTYDPPELSRKLIEYSLLPKERARFEEGQVKSIKKFDSLISCANNKVRELVNEKIAPVNLKGVLNEIERIFNNFKIILTSLRSQYQKNKKLLKTKELIQQLSSDREIIYFLLRSFLDEISIPKAWQKDVKLFQGYIGFFKTYDDLKKSLSVNKLKDIEIENFLKLLEIIPLDIVDKKTNSLRAVNMNEERKFVTQFVDKLQQFIAKKNKSWYLTGAEKKMVNDAKEIINALNNQYQITSDLDTMKMYSIKEPAKQIIISELTFLLEILSTLIQNIKNLE